MDSVHFLKHAETIAFELVLVMLQNSDLDPDHQYTSHCCHTHPCYAPHQYNSDDTPPALISPDMLKYSCVSPGRGLNPQPMWNISASKKDSS